MNLYSSFDDAWTGTIRHILHSGASVLKTREMIAHSVVFPMKQTILTNRVRAISKPFMFAEAAWILGGSNLLSGLISYAPSYKRFSDDGITLSGAYGPKIIDQMRYVKEILLLDKDSRQAVINIWRESPRASRDIPCTLSVQFLIRENKLHTIVTMRSNDVWLGMPYDVFSFTMLSLQLGIELSKSDIFFRGLELGYMTHNAGSRHIYDKDIEKAKTAARVYNDREHPPISIYDTEPLLPDSSSLVTVLKLAATGPQPLANKLRWLTT